MKSPLCLYWSRRDFRLNDNPALFAVIKHSQEEKIPFLPLFILEEYMLKGEGFGYPSRYFLSVALPRFAQQFSNFTILQGKAAEILISLSKEYDLTIFVNEDIYEDFYTQLNKIKNAGINIKLYADQLTISKETKTGAGKYYSIFTPFKNNVWNEFCLASVLTKAQPKKALLASLSPKFKSIQAKQDILLSVFSTKRTFEVGGVRYDIDTLLKEKGDYSHWYFDETSALKQFDTFLKHITEYKEQRDFLNTEGASRMSLALAWGLVSARTLKQKIQKHFDDDFTKISSNPSFEGPAHYLSELIWREFYKYLLFHNKELMDTEFQEKFRGTISWVDDKEAHHRFTKWIQGETGYPIVDAAMMELAQTGYMHNRARMIVASVLTKNFGVDWRWGQEYFRAMLVDLDEASNNGGWQWGASVGADPKPIRIFNPYLQAENYDKHQLYQKKFLREDYFENPPLVLIEHKKAREEALSRYGLQKTTPREY